MKEEEVYIGAYWKNRRITARKFIKSCHRFLAELQKVSTSFSNRCIVFDDKSFILPKDYNAFEQILVKVLNDPEYLYENPDPTVNSFSLDSSFSRGYMVSFSDPDPKATAHTALSISVTAGAYGEFSSPNSVLIEISPVEDEFRANTEKAKELLQLVVTHWHPTFAALTSNELTEALDPEYSNDFGIGILTYFSDMDIAEIVNETASREPMEGGVLFSIDAPKPWASSLNLFKPFYNRLNGAHLLKWQR